MTYIPDLIRQRLADLATNRLKKHPAILSRLKIELESYSGITIWMTSVVSNMEFGMASALHQMQHIDEKLLDRIDLWTKGQPEFLRVRAPFAQANTAKPVTEVEAEQTGAVVERTLNEPDKTLPQGVNTRAMADSFAGLRWNAAEWIKKLGNKPVWLENCLLQNAARGQGMRLWNPVLIGARLVRMDYAKANRVRAKFQTQLPLKPWLEEWRTYEDDNHPTD